MTKKF